MAILDGKILSEKILTDLVEETTQLKAKGITPGLAVILVGDDPASQSYVNSKEKACQKLGMYSEKIVLPKETSEKELLSIIQKLNKDPKIHGILVQSPVPKHINENRVTEAINPSKDVDGFHPVNVGRLVLEQDCFVPCTPLGIIKLLEHYGISVEGKHVVIIGRSHLVGKPMALLFMQKAKTGNATVTVCHSRTNGIQEICKQADILVAAIGKAGFVTKDFVKEGAVIIDVGINRVEDTSQSKGYRMAGDVAFDEVNPISSWITPVPGGVGKMTIAMLMMNVIKAAKMPMTP